MSKKHDKPLIVGLDIGTTKIVVLVGEVTSDGRVEIIGMGTHPSRGLKRGVVVNIESTMQAIARSLAEAELMAGCKITSVYAGIAGAHINSLNSHGIVAIRSREVTRADMERVIDAATAVAIPADQQVLHVLPQEYIIDGQEGIKEPEGMSGVRLESRVHIITGAVSAAQNIIKCVQSCGLRLGDVNLEQLASSHSVLTEDEKELGVCMIDIGGGTTDIAIFIDGAIRHTAVIPIAGDQVTNDIAVGLRTPTQSADKIKIEHATVILDAGEADVLLEVPSAAHGASRKISKGQLSQIVRPRYEELFEMISIELRRSGFDQLIASGVVLTGGASKMRGAVALATSILGMPVRLGEPKNINGMVDVINNPIYATSVGLLLFGYQQQHQKNPKLLLDTSQRGVWDRMKGWFQRNF
jgi:cell division protein FtsA